VADLAEAMGGIKLGALNAGEPLAPEQRVVSPAPGDDPWAQLGRWMREGGAQGRISFRSRMGRADFGSAQQTLASLRAAVEASPRNPELLERLAQQCRQDNLIREAELCERRARRLRQ
jgi:hypothetical protein